SGDHEQRLKYVVKGLVLKGASIDCSRLKTLVMSAVLELSSHRIILIVRSSDAVAKYLLAGSNVSPFTKLRWKLKTRIFSKLCPDQTTTLESSPTDTRILESA